MAMLPPHIADALNILLAEERASVECEVAFTSGAGEYLEREAFTMMGREDVEICDALHQELVAADAPVTPQVSPAGENILILELYDDRLRAFAQHQRAVSQRAGELLGELPEGELQRTVQRLSQSHVWHALWAERHADEFAATRFWENGRQPRPGQGASADAPAPQATDGGGLRAFGVDMAGGDTREQMPGSDGTSARGQRDTPGGAMGHFDEG